ncbi:MAG: molybdopterin-synthase adenylyltransferase MoeB [Bacteroidetes bacterium]|nr:molybdopterin-synthase adenylyltransferase MoeB [Bacteroidota bacterium]
MSTNNFSSEELARYNRHIIIPEFGMEGQLKLKNAKVMVIGTGGLGSPLLLYLAAAGVGTLGIVDFDVVDESNLQRQVLFSVNDVGRPKVEAAKERIEGINPHIKVNAYNVQLTSENALELFKDYDLVADGTDNFPTRYLVNDACVFTGIPNIYASIFRFDGQVSVFNYTDKNGQTGPNYRDLYAEPPPPGLVPSCAEGGVLGVLPGIIGSLQANEVIKVITGIGEPLSGKLYTFDALTFSSRTFKIGKDKTNPLTGEHPTQKTLIDYEQFCGIPQENEANKVAEITVQELKDWMVQGKDFQLIDVREPHEYDIVNIGAELIPLKSVVQNAAKIDRDRPVVVHCKMGGRSATAIKALQEKGFDNLLNLKGGITAFAKEIDTSLVTY